jgi:hypothetical protein
MLLYEVTDRQYVSCPFSDLKYKAKQLRTFIPPRALVLLSFPFCPVPLNRPFPRWALFGEGGEAPRIQPIPLRGIGFLCSPWAAGPRVRPPRGAPKASSLAWPRPTSGPASRLCVVSRASSMLTASPGASSSRASGMSSSHVAPTPSSDTRVPSEPQDERRPGRLLTPGSMDSRRLHIHPHTHRD